MRARRILEGMAVRDRFSELYSHGISIPCFTDLFLRRFREGISFPNFVERSIPDLPLSKLCAVPFALQNRALFEGGKGRKVPRKGEKEGWPAKGAKRKKGRVKTGQFT